MERERIQDVIENISRRLHNGLHNKKDAVLTKVSKNSPSSAGGR